MFELRISELSKPFSRRKLTTFSTFAEVSAKAFLFCASLKFTDVSTEIVQFAVSDTTLCVATPFTFIPLGLRNRMLGFTTMSEHAINVAHATSAVKNINILFFI